MEPTTIKVNKVISVFGLKHTQPAIIKVGDRRYKVEARVDEEQRIVKLVSPEDNRIKIEFDIHGDSEGVEVETAVERAMVYGDLEDGQFFSVTEGMSSRTETGCKNLWTDIHDNTEVQLLDVKKLRSADYPMMPLSQCEIYTKVEIEIGGSSYKGKILTTQSGSDLVSVQDKKDEYRTWRLPPSALCKPLKTWNCWGSVPIGIAVTSSNKCGVKISPEELLRPSGNIEKIPKSEGSWLLTGLEVDHCSWKSFVDKSDLTI